MQLHTLLSSDTIQLGLNADTKESAISELIDLLEGHPAVTDLDLVRNSVLEREEEMSTGVGKGLGLPHAKTNGVTTNVAALAIITDGLDFDAVDEEAVRIIFLLVGPPDSKSIHVRILSRISRLMNIAESRTALLAAKSNTDVLHLIKRLEIEMIAG